MTDRKIERVKAAVSGLVEGVKNIESEASRRYVQTEEFEELLDRTLRRAADERSEQKRTLYRNFLVNAVKYPDEGYDEQVVHLRVLEQLQPEHIKVIEAIRLDPRLEDQNKVPTELGRFRQTLQDRLPGMRDERIDELVDQLNMLRLTTLDALNHTMSAAGSRDMRSRITKFGSRFLDYVAEDAALD